MWKKREIQINWGKIKIIIDGQTYATYVVRKRLPENYQKMQFITSGTLMGQQINIQQKTNQAIQARLNQANGGMGNN